MTLELYDKIWRVTAWRETVPKTPWRFATKRLVPGQQIEITEHRVKFEVTRNFSKHPNACNITIFNLSEETRSDLETLPLKVQIEAGYNRQSRLLYVGDLVYGASEQKGEDWETLLQLGDGGRSFQHARVNRSYKAGTPFIVAIKDAAASMGLVLPVSVLEDPELRKPIPAGAAVFGPTRDEFGRLLAPFGYHWSVENGQLRVLRDEEVVNSGGSAIPIDEEHGMIGTPTFGSPPKSGKPPRMNCNMLLYPELTAGDLVKLTSKARTGLFRLQQVRHVGDSHSTGEWNTTCEISPY